MTALRRLFHRHKRQYVFTAPRPYVLALPDLCAPGVLIETCRCRMTRVVGTRKWVRR